MLVEFCKYQSVGNDFVLVDLERNQNLNSNDYPRLAASICNRHFGVGSDGLILLSGTKMLFLNPDGTYDICGNGMRCVADYVFFKTKKNSFAIQTDFTEISVNILKDNLIETIHPRIVKFSRITSTDFDGVLVDPGTPHFCVFNCDLNETSVEQLGSRLEKVVVPNE